MSPLLISASTCICLIFSLGPPGLSNGVCDDEFWELVSFDRPPKSEFLLDSENRGHPQSGWMHRKFPYPKLSLLRYQAMTLWLSGSKDQSFGRIHFVDGGWFRVPRFSRSAFYFRRRDVEIIRTIDGWNVYIWGYRCGSVWLEQHLVVTGMNRLVMICSFFLWFFLECARSSCGFLSCGYYTSCM